ncbi:MAG TPA: nucleoside monophosphate kinase [Caldisericia bacterium]|nr:nucleoside monophosphate kinase [Caldisericia bacterium]HPF49300.1 nucleoside monophosphate kinase [Caldisericia bacterium]HPI84020.1 nucleoside monophosphate kinase [Caldisericia bacterium]HPQ93278.1 nucleoside monophosphate kinase [Caldisericia bacterium]HRV75340.1 nucleoside monophosphate kinase [Caldisericia bacterium]
MRLILLGPPGSGKGTAARSLSERLAVPSVIASDLLREEIAKGTEMGQEISGYMTTGGLVPDHLVVSVVLPNLEKLNGFILDGYPRTVVQAEKLEEYSSNHHADIDAVVYFDLPLEVAMARNRARMTCASCGFSPPAGAEVCPNCGGALNRRLDDEDDVIEIRFSHYLESTKPLVDFYSRRDILLRIDASKSIKDVETSILSGLGLA